MIYRNFVKTFLSTLFILVFMSIAPMAWTHAISLSEAESIALAHAPELKQLEAKQQAFEQSSIAAGQLSDPKLMLSAMNVPVDTFNLSQEGMTQLQVGLQQAFPRGHSLKYRSLKKHHLAQAELEKEQVMRAQILREVRIAWFNLYYWQKAKYIVRQQKKVFRHLVKVTESLLANNKIQQKDLIRAQLELTDLDNRLINVSQQIDTARIQLARWIGPTVAKRIHASQLPSFAKPPSLIDMGSLIKDHPALRTDSALISASYAGVKLAKQQYNPGFLIGVNYGFRQGHNMDSSRRADFLSAQMSLDLSLFPRNRQDRVLQASQKTFVASQENQQVHYRQLQEALKTHYTAWQKLRKSVHLYQRHLIPKAKQYAEATLVAYQNDQTDFPTLARSYVRELEIQLAGLQTVVARDKARINLFYLQGK